MSSEFSLIGLCALAITASFFVRWYIRPRAPFYDPFNILLAGVSLGVGLSLFLSALASEMDLAGWRLAALHTVAIVAIGFVAVLPEPIDSSNKTLQVVIVAGLAYAACSFFIFLFVFGSYLVG